MSKIQQAADALIQASIKREPCEPIRNLIGDANIDSAYKVQDIITRHRLTQGNVIVGRKIGLTSPAVQKQLGVDQPDYGSLFKNMEVMNGGTIPWIETMQPKAEAEIAFILGKDLDGVDISIARVMSAIKYAVPCIEIVGSRVKNWDIKITDTIADNASASHFVIGHQAKKLNEIDLINCKMVMTKNGEQVSEGLGAACLGSPINATWWLAQTMQKLGTPLKAGQIVLAGALGPMANAAPGDHFEAHIEGLGTASVSFGE